MVFKSERTDSIIKKALEGYKVEIEFDKKTECKVHPNTFDVFAYKEEKLLDNWRVYSIGGGTFKIEGDKDVALKDFYNQRILKK